jgi:DNA-binding FadR family transcriptional regulator
MEIRFDWSSIYDSVLVSGGGRENAAHKIARGIRREVIHADYLPGSNLGRGPELCRRYAVGRETLLEASRLLTHWDVAAMKRGPGGGLIVLSTSRWRPASAIATHLRSRQLTRSQHAEAWRSLLLLQSYSESATSGRTTAFDAGFQANLERGASPLSGAPQHAPDRWNRTLRPFADALTQLEQEHADAAQAEADGSSRTLAAVIADHLAKTIGGDHDHLGFESDLIERMGVSRQVMRQAIRLLQGTGQVRCERGRGRGISASAAHPPILVERLSEYFEQIELSEAEYRPVLHVLARLTRLLAAAKMPAEGFSKMARKIRNPSWDDPTSHMEALAEEWALLDNPVLTLLTQTLCGYRCLRAFDHGSGILLGELDVPRLEGQLSDHLAALKAANYAQADRTNVQIDATLNETFGRF